MSLVKNWIICSCRKLYRRVDHENEAASNSYDPAFQNGLPVKDYEYRLRINYSFRVRILFLFSGVYIFQNYPEMILIIWGENWKIGHYNANFVILYIYSTYYGKNYFKKRGWGRKIIFRENINLCKIWNFKFLLRK